MDGFIYPIDVFDWVKKRWNRKIFKHETIPSLPDKEILQNMIDVVYHASFLTEERRRIWFRVVFISEEEMGEQKEVRPYTVVKFSKPRVFSVNELVKLAPAADPTQVLIAVHRKNSQNLEIWGLIEAGASWWDFGRHEARMGRPPPNAFTLSSKRPGQINISRTGFNIMILEQGRIIGPSTEVFQKGRVADFLKRGADSLYNDVCKSLGRDSYDPKGQDDDYPRRYYVHFLQRILNRIRERYHGGTLILVPDDMRINDTRLKDRVVIKYPCHYDAWDPLVADLVKHAKYFKMHFELWDKKEITKDEYRECSHARAEKEETEENVTRAAGFISSLAAVDGAVVLTDRFRLLGFGAEIVAISPSLEKVKLVNTGKHRNIELYGTRHRSAFRFCSSYEDSVTFIVSQDGEVRIAKRMKSEVFLWSNINVTSLGF